MYMHKDGVDFPVTARARQQETARVREHSKNVVLDITKGQGEVLQE